MNEFTKEYEMTVSALLNVATEIIDTLKTLDIDKAALAAMMVHITFYGDNPEHYPSDAIAKYVVQLMEELGDVQQ